MHIFATQKFQLSSFFLLQNIAFRVLVILTSLLLLVSDAVSEKRIIDFDNFQFEVSEDFEQINHSAAIVYIRHKTQQYPTFNVIKSSLAWQHIAASPDQQMRKMEQEYRAVGIKNVNAISASKVKIDNINAYLIELSFISAGKNFISNVWVISSKDRHYLLTAVIEAEAAIQQKAAINQIISSLRANSPDLEPALPEYKHAASGPDNLEKKYSLLLLSIIFIGYFYFRRARGKSKS